MARAREWTEERERVIWAAYGTGGGCAWMKLAAKHDRGEELEPAEAVRLRFYRSRYEPTGERSRLEPIRVRGEVRP